MDDRDEGLDRVGAEVEGEVLDLLGEDDQELFFAVGQFWSGRANL